MDKINRAENEALDMLLASRPAWRSQKTAQEVLDLDPGVILHAGPKFESPKEIPKPVLNSACAAAIFEGLTKSRDDAEQMILREEIVLEPAQDRGVVIPLAGAVSRSMWLHEVVDSINSTSRVFAPINGGNGPAMRLGMFNKDVVAHLHWINGQLNEILMQCLTHEIDLLPVAIYALSEGDDCHGYTPTATARVCQLLATHLQTHEKVDEFLNNSPSFFLNLWMAACKLMCSQASGIYQSSLVTAAGGNGRRFGIKISKAPDTWITVKATPPVGDIGKFLASRALGAIGDSAIVDICGFGAMAFTFSPQQQHNMKRHLPANLYQKPKKILAVQHPEFRNLEFRTGLLARKVMETQILPSVSLGIIDKTGKAGRLGGGIYTMPLELFEGVLNQA